MKMLTAPILKALKATPLCTHDGTDPAKVPVLVKFFCPWGGYTWYVTEGNIMEDGDWRFFGFVYGQCGELGYFMLSELTSVTGPGGLKIERDHHYQGTLADAAATHRAQ